jgi:hypothetical protein
MKRKNLQGSAEYEQGDRDGGEGSRSSINSSITLKSPPKMLRRPLQPLRSLLHPRILANSTKPLVCSPILKRGQHTNLFSLPPDPFLPRHVGPTPSQISQQLSSLESRSVDNFISTVIPENIRLSQDEIAEAKQVLGEGIGEIELLKRAEEIAGMNKPSKSYIGGGYVGSVLPPVILRNVSLPSRDWVKCLRSDCL